MCVTSPNANWIPEYPVDRQVVKTFTDGRWGVREYSRWPQLLTMGMVHLACIPTPQSAIGRTLREVLWQTFGPLDWVEDRSAAMPELGMLDEKVVQELEAAAEDAIAKYSAIRSQPQRRMEYGYQLVLILRQCVERLKLLPATVNVAVAVAAHVQRLSLELAGLHCYLTIVLPRMDSSSDFRLDVLQVIGAFVNNAAGATTLMRVGVPVFYLQPLTTKVKVWKVVPVRAVGDVLSTTPMAVPSNHDPREYIGAVNLTSNWNTHMVVALSRELCAPSLPGLPSASLAPPPTQASTSKRPRSQPLLGSKDLALPVHARPPSKKGTAIGTKKVHRSSGARHPSREHMPSPFYEVPQVWASALRDVGLLQQAPHAVLYFYPPPFLLDTASSLAPAPDRSPPNIVRHDEKVHRYLHNLIRIREFCRVRLFDPTIDGKAMSISEWRAALWGDYTNKDFPLVQGSAADQKRAKRRYEERNAIARLFGNLAHVKSYDEADVVLLDDRLVNKEVAARSRLVRVQLLWEAHEINFRCDVMALDRAMVPRDEWPIMHRWEREAGISGVWGRKAGAISVLPDTSVELFRFYWLPCTDPRWRVGVPCLQRMVMLMRRWTDFPEALRQLPKDEEDWDVELYARVQAEVVGFYVRSFVSKFHRLPIPPIMYPIN
ncbi:hypothetical protein C8Q73DRAFT_658502 [Cubamyces lactineus]|nr:hypothetical protein C8Q73DRAFT_658502 [Cubamyces lactineus]